MPELRRHVCLHFDELRDLLGLEGDVRRIYVEPDNDYVHIQLDWRSQRPAPEEFRLVSKGGYCEVTPIEYQFSRVNE